ncbi:MAG: 50S ribosomal protein L4 [Euryarchaeota archaeon]|nr:50S ribosomal protein L4 [Euryarchaeota archaeon]RPG72000.1 MAG: 50S ribosomal protein L4 [Euryarchaeota archaeon TMED192]|tara:strand:- start:4474 stop:5352 length:879 start_codon:yes stop_codon:yes gene_type:complete
MKATSYSLNNEISQIEVDAGLLSETYEVSTENGSKVELPESFSSDIREDMVKDAVHSSRANRRQPYGHRTHDGKKAPQAGMKHSVEWWGKGRGVSRIMRKTGQRTAAQNPHTRGGRRAHGPLVEKDWSMKFNTKQKRIARDSAIAATCNAEIVASRGHRFDESLRFPIIIDKYTEVKDGQSDAHDPESIPLSHATRKFVAMMQGLGLGDDLDRAKNGRSIRAGKGKMRGRRRRTPKSVLLVVSQTGALSKAARNVPGVDVVAARDLCAEDLAPGGDIGRLTVWTKKAIEEMR